MRIPEVRERLRELAERHDLPELDTLAGELVRRRNARPVPVRSAPVTEKTRAAVRAYSDLHPELPMTEVARIFELNQGRVSEIRHGKRS
jgi:hypothetical protein